MASDNSLSAPQIDWNGAFELLGDDENSLLKIKAAHRFACGMTKPQIADELGITVEVIKGWQKDDENFNKAVQLIRDNLSSYVDNRMQLRLSQADAYADWILSVDPMRMKGKISEQMMKELIKEKGLTARMYIQKVLENQKPQSSVHISQMVLNVTESAAKVLMQRNVPIVEINAKENPDSES
jgi:hypothetical protein